MSESASRIIKDGIEYEEVQSARRLSESLLWSMQEEYYASRSLAAWPQVPSYSTSRMMFVGAIAGLVNSFILDCVDELNLQRPVYIIELGGGSGCFAYRFINQLKELMADFERVRNLRVHYILSDFTKANIDAHLSNPRLQPLLDSGELEISVYRPESENSIKLEVSGDVLQRGKLTNPLLVIGNYFFDTIRHDAFRVASGELLESNFALYREAQLQLNDGHDRRPTIEEIRMSESHHPAQLPYYRDTHLDSILEFYKDNLRDSSVIFPIGAMKSLANLSHLAEERLAVFASDKGFASLDSHQILGLRDQEFSKHGSFSFDVNFDALQRYLKNVGGSALIESGDHSSLGFMFGTTWKNKFELTRHFFREYMQKRDICNASYNVEEFIFAGCEHAKNLDHFLTNFISIVQTSNFEPFIFDAAFARLFERLVPELGQMDLEQQLEVEELVRRTFQNIFNVGNEYFDLASILEFCMCWGNHQLCLDLAVEANARLGPSWKAYDYAALACEQLDRRSEAYHYFHQSLLLEPNHEWAREGMERNKRSEEEGT